MTTPQNPQALLRSKGYVRLLVLAAVLGVPVSAAAYGFLALVSYLQKEIFTHLPSGLGFHGTPPWWPLPVLTVAGLLVAPVIRYLPGKGGHSPADGFKAGGGAPTAAQLPGVLLAALATLSLGVVLGPEAPLIALGGGLAVLAVRLAKRDMPAQATAVVAAAGSFAAVSTLLGSPIVGAFLLMEASGLGGAMMGVVLLPGLLASGVGALIFVGLDSLTGLGTFSLSIPGLPHFARPDIAEFGWALVIGVAAAFAGTAIRRLGLLLRPHVERRILLLTPVVGIAIAGLAIAYTEGTGKSYSDVLFSGQSQLGPLVSNAASYSVGALLLLLACKVACLRRVAEQLPRRADLPRALHRRGRRHRAVPPARAAAGAGGGDGHRRDVRRHAAAAADIGAAGLPAAVLGRNCRHAAGDRGRRRGLRGISPAAPGPGPGPGWGCGHSSDPGGAPAGSPGRGVGGPGSPRRRTGSSPPAEGAAVTKPSDGRLLRYARPARAYLAGLVVVSVAVAGLVIVQAQLLATAITGVFRGGLDLAALTGTIVALAAVVAGRAVLAWAIEALSQRASAGVKSQLRRDLLRRSVELGPRWLASRRAGELTTLTTTGVDSLDGYFAQYLPQVVLAVVIPLAVVARVLAADLLSGVIILVTLPLVPLFMGLVGATTAERTRRRWRELARLSHHFLDVVAGLTTLRVFGRAHAQATSVGEVTGAYRRATLATLRLAFLSALVLELLATYSVALVAVAIGLRLQGGHLGLRTGLLVLVLAPEAYLPLRQLASHYHASADGLAAAGDVFDVLDTKPETAGERSVGPAERDASVPGGTPAPRAVPAQPARERDVRVRAVRAVRVEDVQVRHPGRSQPAPAGATLRFSAGEVVALAGSSGSGKSTLIGVLLGFITPDAGRVVIEDADGERGLDQLDPRSWRARVAWVPQDPVLQHGTVASNIRLGVPAAPREAVERAAARAALHEVDLGRPVGEGGAGLSAGQRRRVAVARALLTQRPVLLLDEPTAGLDAAAEAEVLASVRELATDGRLVLMVAHRPAVLAAADRVVTLPLPAPAVTGRPGSYPGATTGVTV